MIFSHFKRRRGIRFDDGFRHSARDGAAPDPDAPPVDGALANYDAYSLDLDANDPVAEWEDNASAGPATQETLAAQPTYAPDVLDSGTPGVEFSGSQYLFLPDVLQLSPADGWTQYFVLLRTSGANQIFASWYNGDSSVVGWLANATSSDRLGWRVGTGSQGLSPDDSFGSTRTRISLDNSGAGGHHRGFIGDDLLIERSTPTDPSIPSSGAPVMLGARDDGAGGAEFHFTGFLQQVIFYPELHDAVQRAETWDWLDERWLL